MAMHLRCGVSISVGAMVQRDFQFAAPYMPFYLLFPMMDQGCRTNN